MVASLSFKFSAIHVTLCLLVLRSVLALSPPKHWQGAQGVNLWKLQQLNNARSRPFDRDTDRSQVALGAPDEDEDEDEDPTKFPFPPLWFKQPLDHFDPKNTHEWRQRYWVNTRYYRPNTSAPVIVLDGGETSGYGRLPFLDTGIVEILAKATGGVGVILEHRYYGQSIPVNNFTTDSLRWLNNAQSAADSANFMAKVQFPGIHEDLTAPGTPWIYYGGSYAGARAAHMRTLYPDLVFGAIASSGVTHASLLNWEYMDIIRLAADPACSQRLVESIQAIDLVLENEYLKKPLKSLFGLGDLQHDEDFVSLLTSPLGSWQAKNWDPAIGSTGFEEFCNALDKPISTHAHLLNNTLTYDHATEMVTLPGGLEIAVSVLNYAQYVRENIASHCPEDIGIEECFGTFDSDKYESATLFDTWRLWLFQVCTEWGYFFTAPPDPQHPRIVSKLLTLEYESMICRQAFPPGDYFTVPPSPNITAVNSLGDFDIAADRLAIIDGEIDPWRPCTPHSSYADDRPDTTLRPFKIIPNGVHHYDEFGLTDMLDEPPEILEIHLQMIEFVKEWLGDWEKLHRK